MAFDRTQLHEKAAKACKEETEDMDLGRKKNNKCSIYKYLRELDRNI